MTDTHDSPAQPLVLVADDEASIRLLVRVNLEAEGFAVCEAGDGNSTLELVRSTHPDVLLLDVMMPGKDGWAVAQELLADPETADIPIVFLTARADLRDHERGLECGALQYITKPFNPRSLAPAIHDCIAGVRSGEAARLREERIRVVRSLQQRPE